MERGSKLKNNKSDFAAQALAEASGEGTHLDSITQLLEEQYQQMVLRRGPCSLPRDTSCRVGY